MEKMLHTLSQPWPWYLAGPLIGFTVPLLLILGNRAFGISSSLRHICAACLPANIGFLQYDWRKESWNLFLVAGLIVGGVIAGTILKSPEPISIHDNLREELQHYGISDVSSVAPEQLFNFRELLTLRGFVLMVVGGFLVGFGARYAGGCTSGHAITGISNLQVSSIIATICFMIGGLVMANFILPFILKL